MKHLVLALGLYFALMPVLVAQRQDIDVQLLSAIVAAKQEELRERILSDLVVKNIKTTNYTTYNTIYNLVNIITTEKNKVVMTQDITQQIADYAIAYGLTTYFMNYELNAPVAVLMDKVNRTEVIQQVSREVYVDYSLNDQKTALLQNFLIDTLYQKLRVLGSTPNTFFYEKGLFQNDPLRPFFSKGLQLDYSVLEGDARLDGISNRLDEFLEAALVIATNTEDIVFDLLEDSEFNLTKFVNISEEGIRNLFILFELSISLYREQIGENSFIATIGDIIKRYVIYDVPEADIYRFRIDVEAIILAFEDKFVESKITNIKQNKIGIKPSFEIGLNYGYFTNADNNFELDGTTVDLRQLALAAEKIGLKFVFMDLEYTRSFSPMEWYQYKGKFYRWENPPRKSTVNKVYGMVSASGLLYNVVDLKNEENFDYALIAAGFGIEFFNGLQMNLECNVPIVPGDGVNEMWRKNFIALGLDIPIFEYLRELRRRE
ncbi:MAG: hypothetical protein HC892_05155 [Saprospiraceae bacterium]|nr:hypothetical protein [Saprospiraceae bacterium]